MPAFGYDTLLEVQPASVDVGFRLFLTISTAIGFLLAIFLLWLYPLHGKRLNDIRAKLLEKADKIEPARMTMLPGWLSFLVDSLLKQRYPGRLASECESIALITAKALLDGLW